MDDQFRRGDVVVDRYELHEVVGSGAGGRIFLAFDRNLGGRETALKIYEPDTLIADLAQHVRQGTIARDVYEAELSNIYARFRQEAIRISRLDHPSIVKVFDYRDSEYQIRRGGMAERRNRPFLAMEFVRGGTLEDHLQRGSLRLLDTLEIASQVADGLAYAHSESLVHRDLKPSNIMVEDTPLGMRVRVIDWGVAKVVASEAQLNMTRIISRAGGEDIHTRGILLGTPKFIAPEHFGTNGAKWSPASDVFAMGVFMFRMVTGHAVRRESYIGECLTETDRERLRQSCSSVPVLAEIVMKCLSEIRQERPSADQLRDQLREIQGGLLGKDVDHRRRFEGVNTRTADAQIDDDDQPTRALSSLVVPQGHSAAAAADAGEALDDYPEPDFQTRRSGGVVMALVALVVGIAGGVFAADFFAGESATADSEQGAVAGAGDPSESSNSSESSAEPGGGGAEAAGGAAAVPVPLPGGTLEAVAAVPVPAVDPNAIELMLPIESVPPSRVLALGSNGWEELGKTPLDMKLTHRYEARRLRFEPLDTKTFVPLDETVLAIDYLDDPQSAQLRVKLKCVNVFDPKCSDVLKELDENFLQEAGDSGAPK